jgi:hypothetical protein
MTNLRNFLLTIAALAILPGAAARADSIAINFMPSTLSAMPGQTVTFSGTITNLENATVDLNSCDVNLPGQFTTDSCVAFLLSAPLFLGPLETSAPFDMFTVTVNQPFIGPIGLQPPGIFTVLGGPDGDAQNVLGQATFAVAVTSVAAPEPGSFVLLGLALTMTLALRRRSSAPID